jgi:hypothetical protein
MPTSTLIPMDSTSRTTCITLTTITSVALTALSPTTTIPTSRGWAMRCGLLPSSRTAAVHLAPCNNISTKLHVQGHSVGVLAVVIPLFETQKSVFYLFQHQISYWCILHSRENLGAHGKFNFLSVSSMLRASVPLFLWTGFLLCCVLHSSESHICGGWYTSASYRWLCYRRHGVNGVPH